MKTNELSVTPFHSNFGVNNYIGQFNSIVDQFFNDFWNEPSFVFSRNWRPTQINENENNYSIEIEIPRIKKNQLKVEAKGNTIKVSANSENIKFERIFSQSEWDTSQTNVKLEDGVLYLTVPKTEKAKGKVIEIS